MVVPRPVGTTNRRMQEALHRPHPASERFDPEFPLALQCRDCGQVGVGPRKHLKEAIDEHRLRCPAKRTRREDVHITRILSPRV